MALIGVLLLIAGIIMKAGDNDWGWIAIWFGGCIVLAGH
jgi:hypothetical protein